MSGEGGEAIIEEWGVRSDAGGSGIATYGPYSSRQAAEEVRDRLVEGGGWLISRRVTDWADVPNSRVPSTSEGEGA